MAPPSEHPSDTTSSLGDSAYEILGDSTHLTSDEEDRDYTTDSLASIDGHGADDVSSIAGTEESADTPSSSGEPDPPDFITPSRARAADPQDVSCSGVTVTEDEPAQGPAIEFEEPPCYGSEQVAVIHTVCNFDEQRTAEILEHIRPEDPPARIAATIRQTMSRQGLAVDEPFRILYVGSPTAKGEIVAKIAAALAVPTLGRGGSSAGNQRSSRFNVVPISSFGAGRSPEVELIDSFGLELVVDECTGSRFDRDKRHGLSLHLNDSFWYTAGDGIEGVGQDPKPLWRLPHVAIFFVSDSVTLAARRNHNLARSFVLTAGVPSIVISETPMYGRPVPDYAVNHHGVHMCLESRGPGQGGRVLRRLPIDLPSFLNLDSRQMNRNLACLAGLQAGRREFSAKAEAPRASQDRDDPGHIPWGLAQSTHILRERKGQEWRALLTFGLILLCAMAGTAFTLAYQKYDISARSAYETANVHVISAADAAASWATLTASVSTTATSQEQAPKARPSLPGEKGTSTSLVVAGSRMDLASLLFDPSLAALNDSDNFKMQIVGDCHMVLRPPHRFGLLKKTPRLFVKVVRKGQVIDVQLSKLFDGVYALQLEREEAYGPLNVTVWTQAKPRIEQTFEMDFGTPWLKVAGWKKAAQVVSEQMRKDVKQAQSAAQSATRWLTKEAQGVMRSAGPGAERVRHEATSLQRLALQRLMKTQALVASRAKDLSRDAAAQGSALSRDVAAWVKDATNQAALRAAHLYASSTTEDALRYYQSLPQRAQRTFTVNRAQKQARRLWLKVWPSSAEAGTRPTAGREQRAGKMGRKSCKKCRR
ncbi:MAG: hypothetical protein M1832_003426 [Thelocarpon impressellum]|nr:MAG: hypothetical protein M1832_003426 [Thelocarpon impressellum]